MKTQIPVNSPDPSLAEMARAAGHALTKGGYIPGRDKKLVPAVILDGQKMAASECRRLLLERYTFVCAGLPCEN